jgi:hypothetical protein
MRRLTAMNVTAGSLFPGIDGLGRSLWEAASLEADRYARGLNDTPIEGLVGPRSDAERVTKQPLEMDHELTFEVDSVDGTKPSG